VPIARPGGGIYWSRKGASAAEKQGETSSQSTGRERTGPIDLPVGERMSRPMVGLQKEFVKKKLGNRGGGTKMFALRKRNRPAKQLNGAGGWCLRTSQQWRRSCEARACKCEGASVLGFSDEKRGEYAGD